MHSQQKPFGAGEVLYFNCLLLIGHLPLSANPVARRMKHADSYSANQGPELGGALVPVRRWWFWCFRTAKEEKWVATADVTDPSSVSECGVLFLPPALSCLCDRRQQDRVSQNSSLRFVPSR